MKAEDLDQKFDNREDVLEYFDITTLNRPGLVLCRLGGAAAEPNRSQIIASVGFHYVSPNLHGLQPRRRPARRTPRP